MRTFSFILSIGLALTPFFAMGASWRTTDGNAALLRAIGICKIPNNPYENALKPLGGNQFGVRAAYADNMRDTIIIADILDNLGGAIALKGTIWVTMTTPRGVANALPDCTMRVVPIP